MVIGLVSTMRVYFTDRFRLPLPRTHPFPMEKYTRLRARVEAERERLGATLAEPPAASDDELATAHSRAYLGRVVEGRLSKDDVRRLGFPWSGEMVERSRRSTGATIAAARDALDDRVAVSLAGGTHHAFADRPEGFCVFNDAAVAARVLRRDGAVRRVLVVDTDVHQGNGTAAIAAGDPSIFTFSIHGARNFPRVKTESDLDVPLEDGTGDEEYLAALDRGLDEALGRAAADLAIWVSGADPLAGDRFGRLALSKAGLLERDARVLERLGEAGLPVAVTMAGGYSRRVDDTVDVHLGTVRTAARFAAGIPVRGT